MTGRFLRDIAVDHDVDTTAYPFRLPIVRGLIATGHLDLSPGVTFLTGDNGSGKSTLVEAIAVAAGFNAEGGSRNFQFATQSTESALGRHLTVGRQAGRRERSNFFFRAESFYNVVTEIDNLGVADGYGGHSLHERSHGESFLDLIANRFHPGGLYLLDEPEAALSPRGLLIALARLHDLTEAGSQMLIATHSPILLALPGATILQVEDDGRLRRVTYDEADAVQVTRNFLADPQRTLRHLLAD
ncbi:AAA family ATPase [Actinoplanes awajinensis]|uniref:ABC transporter ATP-binding protein n=1 Tax=Actinoplanes awajinensis subsp. mycoplanecinus TaxID=135947 RepID=A0A117MR00_9ACTN|nr:AAA family ATPase [Actinoplanes awajinensis]KUL30956.1 ABC transporter ATP-binding protein [Actinoplanes awajinensis subsp. mycoplanecinus]